MQGTDDPFESAGRTAADTDPSLAEQAVLVRGESVGRYVVLDRIGAGGMGVVYGAYDPELDRKVAIKLVIPPRVDADATHARGRLLREAQAMARLSHPNVVTVHDVGTHGDRIYVAMEFVEGLTLTTWLARQTRTWREIVTVMIQAARGLSAAHDKGMTHRDFKPDNVMVGDDGRVRVMDFGLASAPSEPSASSMELSPDSLERSRDLALTRAGSLIGTPAYMAPEQFLGEAVDGRSDQFSFCVALHEALWGRRPFAASSVAGLAYAVTHGKRAAIEGGDVPRWIRAVVDRGLAREPDERFASMRDLVLALQDDRSRRRRRALLFAAPVVLVGAALGVEELRQARRGAACEERGAAMVAAWNDGAAAEVAAGFAKGGIEFAPEAWAHVRPHVDAYARELADATTELCRADDDTQVEPAAAAECLEDRKVALESFLARQRTGDRSAALRGGTAVMSLARPAECLDPRWHATHPVPDEALREQARALRARLIQIAAFVDASDLDRGLRDAIAVREEAAQLGWPPLVISADHLVGLVQQEAGRLADAEATLREVFFAAGAYGDDSMAAMAAARLVYVVGYGQARIEDALEWARFAQMSVERLGAQDTTLHAELLSSLGLVRSRKGDLSLARADLERALAIREQQAGPEHPEVGVTLGNLGETLTLMGEHDAAHAVLARALGIFEAAFGPRHPKVAAVLLLTANVHFHRDEIDEAERLYREALAIRRASLGAEHPEVAAALVNVGSAAFRQNKTAEAREAWESALAVARATLPPDHPTISVVLQNLAVLMQGEGDETAAAEQLDAVATSIERRLGPAHPELARALANLGQARFRLGQYRVAIDHAARASTIYMGADPPSPGPAAGALLTLASSHYELRDTEAAAAAYTRALETLGTAKDPEHDLVAQCHGGLAWVDVRRRDLARAEESIARAREHVAALETVRPLTLALATTADAMVRLERGQHEQALPLFEEALAVLVAEATFAGDIAEARFGLARSLTAKGRAGPRAVELARSAREALVSLGEAHAWQVERIDRWLRAHGGARRLSARPG